MYRGLSRKILLTALAENLDQDGEVLGRLAVPWLERLEKLETVGSGADDDVDGSTVLRWGLEGVLAWVVATRRKLVARGIVELEGLAIGTGEGVGQGVEGQVASEGHGGDDVGRSDEGVSGGISIVTAGEVAVVGGDDRVLLALLDVAAIPLANARSAGVGKDHTANLLERADLTIAGDGSTDLLGTGGDGELGLGFQTVLGSLTGDRSGAGHVLVGRVGARADEGDLELLRPVVLLDCLSELGDGSGQIGSEGTVDVGLKLGEVLREIRSLLETSVRQEKLILRTISMTWSYSAFSSGFKLCWNCLA